MKLTNANRRIRQERDAVEADLQRVVQVELANLFRAVRAKVRRVSAMRPGTGIKRLKLSKAVIYGSTDLWEVFANRLRIRLFEALKIGALRLAQLQISSLLGMEPIEFDSEAYAVRIEPELARRIKDVEISIKRKVAAKTVAWYNSPGMTMQQLIDSLRSDFSPARARNIARNESTFLNSHVQEQLMNRLGLQEWWWSTRRDNVVCITSLIGPDGRRYAGCRELHGKVFKIGQRMPPLGSHIGCRCDPIMIVPKPTKVVEKPIVDLSHLGKFDVIAGNKFELSGELQKLLGGK